MTYYCHTILHPFKRSRLAPFPRKHRRNPSHRGNGAAVNTPQPGFELLKPSPFHSLSIRSGADSCPGQLFRAEQFLPEISRNASASPRHYHRPRHLTGCSCWVFVVEERPCSPCLYSILHTAYFVCWLVCNPMLSPLSQPSLVWLPDIVGLRARPFSNGGRKDAW